MDRGIDINDYEHYDRLADLKKQYSECKKREENFRAENNLDKAEKMKMLNKEFVKEILKYEPGFIEDTQEEK